jgi:hypothetical protein
MKGAGTREIYNGFKERFYTNDMANTSPQLSGPVEGHKGAAFVEKHRTWFRIGRGFPGKMGTDAFPRGCQEHFFFVLPQRKTHNGLLMLW